ncbi:cytochrome P450 [Sporodiniella umbellata]|nr:cytochrome P450 [Sporodiniella umbellata]
MLVFLKNHIIGAISLLLIFSITLLIKKLSKYKTCNSEKIPSPKGAYPIFGHLPLIKGKASLVFTKWHRELGPVIRVKMGSLNWVLISDPEALHEILAKQGKSTSGRPELTFISEVNSPNDSGIAFASYGRKWKNTRNAVLSILSTKSVESLSHIIARENRNVVDMMREKSKNNQALDAFEYSKLAGVNVIMSIVFGIPCPAAMKFTGPAEDYTTMFPILKIFDPIFKRKKKMIEFRDKEYHVFVREITKLARKSKGDSLVKKVDEAKEKYQLSDQNVMSILSEALFIGTETMSSATAWAIAILCHYPEIQKKAHDEISCFIKKTRRHPEYLDKDSLPYFFAVIKECLRFRIPLDLAAPRLVTQDVSYKNYIIPKGYTIYTNMHTVNNDPSLFPNPEKFDPERFMNDTRSLHVVSNGNVERRDNYGFGWGRRICPGIYLTENQMFHLLSRVLFTCVIEPEISPSGKEVFPDLDETVDTGFTVYPAPFKVRLTERIII